MAADKGGSTPPKLPLNARRTPAQPMPIARSPFQPSQQQQRQQQQPYAQSLSHSLGNNAPRPSSFAKATSLLSQPGYLAQHHPSMSPNECTNDSDSVSSSLKRQAAWAIERAEVARRLKRHLVTRPAPTPTRSAALDDGGYAGDTNEEDDELDPHALSADAHEVVDPLQLPSGDITYQIYRWQNKNKDIAPSLRSGLGSESPVAPQSTSGTRGRRESAAANLPRRRSFSAWDSDPEWDLSYRSNQINVPGGFRRQFVRERAERQGRAPPGLIAETFVDFIALYGHFAGGNYLSDEDEEYFDYVHQSYADAAAAADDEETRQPVDERTPLRRVQSSGALHATSSNRKAFFLLIKAFVGTGVLVLPRAFYNGGLLTSCVLMLLVAWYAWHCILLLAEVYLKIGGGSYSDIGLRLYGRWMQYAVTSSIVLAQIGGCCAYTIFVAQNWRNVFNTLSRCHVQLSTEFWVLVQLVVFIPLALIRQIRYFAPVAMLANLLIVVSLGYLLGFDLWSIASNGPAPIANYNPARFPLLVGTAVYSFEGVTLVIPIIESLKEKRDFARVLTLAITLCLGLFLCVGSLSYLTFGESVEAVVLLNMPNDSSWTMLVQLLYSIAILFSMPIQLFPAVKIMEAMMFTRSGRLHKSVKWQKNIFRTVTAIFIAIIAIFGADQLDNVVSLVGSFCLVPLSFIYPSSMHLKLVADTTWMRVKDSILIVVGVAAMIYVTFISITTWGTSDPPIDVCKPSP